MLRKVDQHQVLAGSAHRLTRLQLRPQSAPGNGASVTSTFASPALSSSPIAAGSSSGLIAKTMPAAWPPQIVEMGLRQVRQHEGDDVVLADAQLVEEVGGGRDAREERRVVPGRRPGMVLRRAGRTTAPARRRAPRRRGADHLVGAVRQRSGGLSTARTSAMLAMPFMLSSFLVRGGQGSSTARPALPAETGRMRRRACPSARKTIGNEKPALAHSGGERLEASGSGLKIVQP